MTAPEDPTRAAVARSAEDEQALRFLHRTEGKEDPTFVDPDGHLADDRPPPPGDGEPMHRPAIPVPEGREKEFEPKLRERDSSDAEEKKRNVEHIARRLSGELTEAAAEGAIPS